MKFRNFAILTFVMLTSAQFFTTLFGEDVQAKAPELHRKAADDSFIAIYEKIDAAAFHKNLRQLLSVLSDLDSFHAVSFGNGLGPQDINSLQLTVLRVVQFYFFDVNGKLKPFELKENISDNEKKWLGKISIDPSNSNKVISLLQEEQVAVRWLGIVKASYLTPDASVVKILQQIALNDPYVIIACKPFASKDKKNNLPNNGIVCGRESNFSCPLSEKAYSVLNKWGYKIDIDANSINHKGICYLASLYNNSDSPVLKKQIIDSISLFSPNNSAIALLFSDKTFDKEYQNAIDAFKKAIGSKRNYHVY